MFSASLKSFLILAVSVSASPIVQITSLPVARSFRAGNIRASIEAEKARVHDLQYGTDINRSSKVAATPAINSLWDFAVNVTVGYNPATTYTLVVSTNSAITWVGGNTPYRITSTSYDTGINVIVSHPDFMEGEIFLDQVSLGPKLVIANQSIGAATDFSQDNDRLLDGVLALGPVGLSTDMLSSGGPLPTITDNLYSQGLISQNSFALAYKPAYYKDGAEITWGGVDKSKHTGDVYYTDVTNIFPSSQHWGLKQTIAYGSQPLVSNSAGIISASLTWIHVSTAAGAQYMSLTGAVLDKNTTGLLTITPESYAKLQSLYFNIGGESFEFTPNAQIFPRAFNTAIGGLADNVYLVVLPVVFSLPGFQFALGTVWLERFYAVFDTANKRIGVATTQFTHDMTN